MSPVIRGRDSSIDITTRLYRSAIQSDRIFLVCANGSLLLLFYLYGPRSLEPKQKLCPR